jgi:uncharacterized protein (TIGR02118 family)
MHKLMVVFKSSDDSLTLETQWSTEFVARAERMPGLRRVSVSRIVGGPGGSVDLHLVHELYFDDLDALREALSGPGSWTGINGFWWRECQYLLCPASRRRSSGLAMINERMCASGH